MDDLAIEYRIAKMQLAPGDVLVAKFDVGALSRDTSERAVEFFRGYVPEGVKVMVIDKGVELSILTQKDIAGLDGATA